MTTRRRADIFVNNFVAVVTLLLKLTSDLIHTPDIPQTSVCSAPHSEREEGTFWHGISLLGSSLECVPCLGTISPAVKASPMQARVAENMFLVDVPARRQNANVNSRDLRTCEHSHNSNKNNNNDNKKKLERARKQTTILPRRAHESGRTGGRTSTLAQSKSPETFFFAGVPGEAASRRIDPTALSKARRNLLTTLGSGLD